MMATPTPVRVLLERSFTRLARHQHPWNDHPVLGAAALDRHVERVRRRDNEVLAALVTLAQDGDHDAATVALWGLYPLLIGRVRRHPAKGRLPTDTADLVASTYLVMRDIDTDTPDLWIHLLDRALGRLIKQATRASARELSLEDTAAPHGEHRTQAVDPAHSAVFGAAHHDVDHEALSRLDLAHLSVTVRAAIAAGTITADRWQMVLDYHIHGASSRDLANDYGLSESGARVAVHRTVRRVRAAAA
jgi:hypothetical protein